VLITFNYREEVVTIYLIYVLSKKLDNEVISLTKIKVKSPSGRVVIIVNFNIHNLIWDKEGRRSLEVKPLVRLIKT